MLSLAVEHYEGVAVFKSDDAPGEGPLGAMSRPEDENGRKGEGSSDSPPCSLERRRKKRTSQQSLAAPSRARELLSAGVGPRIGQTAYWAPPLTGFQQGGAEGPTGGE